MQKNETKKRYPCPCCGYLMFDEGPGSSEICSICFWQDDDIDLEKMYEAWGPNEVSLEEGQRNFEKIGAAEERFLGHVRPATDADKREPKWRALDKSKDVSQAINADATDFKALYYWYWN